MEKADPYRWSPRARELPSIHRIVEQHHGRVGVRSAPGRGSAFWFARPLVPAT